MLNLFKYSGLTTKIKAMQSHMFTLEDYKKMSNMNNLKELVMYLKDCKAYKSILSDVNENNIHRLEIEKKLMFSMYKDYENIYKFVNGKERHFLDSYFIYFEIEIIKVLLKMFLSSKPIEYNLMEFEKFFMKHSRIDIKKLSKAETINEFIDIMKDTDYYNILSLLNNGEDITLFDIEMRLDRYYFLQTWKLINKHLNKKDKKFISIELGTNIDLLNILWIYRAKNYYFVDKSIIYSYIIPVRHKLKKSQIKEMVEANNNIEFEEAIKKTYYSKIFDALKEEKGEKILFYTMSKVFNASKLKNPVSLVSVAYFMYFKQVEISNITRIIECIRYSLKPEEITKYIDIYNKNGVIL